MAVEHPARTVDCETALRMLKAGHEVSRVSWQAEGKRLCVQPGKGALPGLVCLETGGKRVLWLCSQAELLADDWVVTDGR
jgi:hypothetical protein